MEGTIRFVRLLELHIVNQFNKRFPKDTPVDNDTLHQMRDLVRDLVTEVMGKSSYKLSEMAQNWVANQVFRNLTLPTTEGKKTIDELVIFNDYKLDDLPYNELQVLRGLFNHHPKMGPTLEDEHKRRSVT